MDTFPTDQVIIPQHENQRQDGSRVTWPAITLGALNSQVAEQYNSKLDTICTQVAYMKQENFMAVVKYYLFRCNQRLLKTSDEAQCSLLNLMHHDNGSTRLKLLSKSDES